MKMSKNNRKSVAMVALALIFVITVTAISFAWFQNYVDVKGTTVKTGSMLYKFYICAKDSEGKLTFLTPEGASTEALTATYESDSTKVQDSVSVTSEMIEIAPDSPSEFFFIIEKLDGSIDFDVSIGFDNDGFDPTVYDYVGSLQYQMYNDSTALCSKSGIADYLSSVTVGNGGTTETSSFGNIWKDLQKGSVNAENKFACIRMYLDMPRNTTPQAAAQSIPLRVNLCAAQTGALPGEEGRNQVRVETADQLMAFMNEYRPGDEVIITQNIEYTGDLLFTRPCTVTVVQSTLTVRGNILLSYIYDDEYKINTSANGHIQVLKNNGGAGNFEIDIPNCSLDLEGLNNIANGKADLYVEGEFTVNVSRDEGVRFNAFRVCEVESAGGVSYKDTLKPMSVSGATRIYTTHRTELGKITATDSCRKITLVNNGYIDGLDLREMKRDETLLASPAIDFDNYGNLRDTLVLLPSWAMKFNEKDIKNYQDNTRIIANVGSGFMQAVSGTRTIEDGPNSYFYSNGNGGSDGLRDDIIYLRRTEFVDLVTEGDLTKIIVHYESPNAYNRPEGAPDAFGTTLGSIIDYYSSIGRIAEPLGIVDMTVICYGDKMLTVDDYDFIKTMTALTTLDLSDSISEGRETPESAFEGMRNLTHVDMPASDTIWNPYIFRDTGVEEIWFPATLQTLNNPKNNKGVVTAQQVLAGVKYVHTGINLVDGMYANINATQYFFTPEEYVYHEYRNLVITTAGLPAPNFARRIFMEADRYGDYFLRLFGDGSCEFVAYVGDSFISGAEKSSEKQFDFEKIIIDGTLYTIRSYDPYAFYRKLVAEKGMSLTFGNKLVSIGEYAFAMNGSKDNGVVEIEFNGATLLGDHAFYDCANLTSVKGEQVTSLAGGYHFAEADVLDYVYLPRLSYVEGDASFGTCPSLQEIHIGVIERTTSNQNLYTSNDSYSFAKFFIHTEFASAAALNYSQALAADGRFIFVASPYDTLYDAYTGRTSMGNHTFEELKTANQNGDTATESDEVAYYYYVNDDRTTATLVACALPTIVENGTDHVTVSEFRDANGSYTVNTIGAAAYHFTAFRGVNTLSVSNGVTHIGRYAFDASKPAFSKYCVTFDLGNVTHMDDHALQYVSMVKLVGNKLVAIGADAIRHNTQMRTAYLPVLTTGPKGTAGVFAGNTELRFTYLGAPDNITYNSADSLTKQYIRFLDTEHITATVNYSLTRSNVSTLINTSCVNLFELGSSKTLTFGGANFSNVVFSDWYDYVGEVDGVSYSIELPGYVYLKDEMVDDRLTLFAVSPDLEMLDSYDSDHYVTPNELYATGKTHESLFGYADGHIGYNVDCGDASVQPAYTVTKIGNYAYSVLRIYARRVTVGSHTTVLENNAFRHLTTGAASGLIYGQSLDLENVVQAGNYAIYQAQITELNAPRLATIGNGTFYACRNLVSAYFPSLVEVTGSDAFYNCTGLTEITFGPNMMAFYHQMFFGASALKTITILNPYSAAVINIGSNNTAYLFGSNTANKGYANAVNIRVPASAMASYKAAYPSNFGGVPIGNFETFENAHTDANNTIFYWQEVGGSAYITSIGGTLPTGTVTLPTAVTKDSTDYTVIAVGPLAMKALTGATKIVLPAGMTSLAFTAADIPVTVTALEIATSNAKFETVDGVLYDKGQTTILVYPKGHTATSFTLPSTVTAIASNAFYGAQRLTTLTINAPVRIADRAFASTKVLTSINFMSATASDFVGVDIIANANDALKLYVPAGTLDTYKAHVWFDHSILDLLVQST